MSSCCCLWAPLLLSLGSRVSRWPLRAWPLIKGGRLVCWIYELITSFVLIFHSVLIPFPHTFIRETRVCFHLIRIILLEILTRISIC
ncbi:hypothetical protein Hanom_Chr11g01064291 [Helianthus anomalus]